MEGVAGNDFDVGGEVLFKCCHLGGFAGGLAADDGAHLGCWEGDMSVGGQHDERVSGCVWKVGQTWTISGDDGVNVLCFNRIDDIVTATRDVVAVLENRYVFLLKASARCLCITRTIYSIGEKVFRTLSLNSSTNKSYLSGRSQACTLRECMRQSGSDEKVTDYG